MGEGTARLYTWHLVAGGRPRWFLLYRAGQVWTASATRAEPSKPYVLTPVAAILDRRRSSSLEECTYSLTRLCGITPRLVRLPWNLLSIFKSHTLSLLGARHVFASSSNTRDLRSTSLCGLPSWATGDPLSFVDIEDRALRLVD